MAAKGYAGGKRRLETMTDEERSESARKASAVAAVRRSERARLRKAAGVDLDRA